MTESGISAQRKEYVAAVYDGKWYIGTEKLSLLMTVSRSNN